MKKKKVIVGISGGVDSAVSALLLKEQGYEVEGMFMRNWDSMVNNDYLGNPNDLNDVCPQEIDYKDALATCQELGIKLHRVDFVQEYWDNVFQYFLTEYKNNRTPNPDILCNSEIKFKCFLNKANEMGCDYIAMGHYARITHGENGHHIYKGSDKNKDQTYFLCQLKPSQIAKALFPIGDITKPEVRRLAASHNLTTSKKKDSTGVCFIGERNFKLFLENYIPARPGEMQTMDGKVVGMHDGIMYYTIGQRHGLGIGGEGDPWFVIGKIAKTNVLLVGQGDDNTYLYSNKCYINKLNFLEESYEKRLNNGETLKIAAKFRYRQKDVKVEVKRFNDLYLEVKYDNVKAVTPGQECVMYDGELLLGGGTIDTVYMDEVKREY
ncbi:MAG: tRNA 2-thiouridine(34) synthase MnmA [Bacilli bacterium]